MPAITCAHVADASAGPPDDYVVSTGEAHTVEEFVSLAFAHAGLDWRQYVVVDPQFYGRRRSISCSASRPRRGGSSAGGPWSPSRQLVTMMVDADLAALSAVARPGSGGGLKRRGCPGPGGLHVGDGE